MLGTMEEGVGFGEFDELADIHDRNPIADVFDDTEVVGDEEIGEAEFVLQAHEQVEDLSLNRDIEGRDRLIGDDQTGWNCSK